MVAMLSRIQSLHTIVHDPCASNNTLPCALRLRISAQFLSAQLYFGRVGARPVAITIRSIETIRSVEIVSIVNRE